MAIRKYKPTTPGRRGSSVADFVEITRSTPEKSLTRPLPKNGGRNNQGRITTRHKGGGHKRAYRIIDFRRYDKDGVPAKVAHIEYDPNRTARIALLHYADGEKRYIVAPKGYEVKGNADSGLYHEPEGQWYDATEAEFWFKSAEDAEAAGFTRAGGAAAEKTVEDDK